MKRLCVLGAFFQHLFYSKYYKLSRIIILFYKNIIQIIENKRSKTKTSFLQIIFDFNEELLISSLSHSSPFEVSQA